MGLFELKNKVAVVTGGAKGIGAATARLLEQAGARVHVLDIESGCDVSKESEVRKAYEGIGALDILVNNAGRAVRKTAIEVTKEEWDAVLELNLTATFLCSRFAHPYMKKRGGGAIVNLASIMGLSGGIYPNASYQASKGAVVNLTRAHRPHRAHLLQSGDDEDRDGTHAARAPPRGRRHRRGDPFPVQRRGALHYRGHAAGRFRLPGQIKNYRQCGG